MTVEARILVADVSPPLTHLSPSARRVRRTDPLPRLRRIVCVVAALALPALGIAVADTVHRAGGPRASEAAAPVTPSGGAAAPLSAVKTAAHQARRREVRS
jgi:hypothetical protein